MTPTERRLLVAVARAIADVMGTSRTSIPTSVVQRVRQLRELAGHVEAAPRTVTVARVSRMRPEIHNGVSRSRRIVELSCGHVYAYFPAITDPLVGQAAACSTCGPMAPVVTTADVQPPGLAVPFAIDEGAPEQAPADVPDDAEEREAEAGPMRAPRAVPQPPGLDPTLRLAEPSRRGRPRRDVVTPIVPGPGETVEAGPGEAVEVPATHEAHTTTDQFGMTRTVVRPRSSPVEHVMQEFHEAVTRLANERPAATAEAIAEQVIRRAEARLGLPAQEPAGAVERPPQVATRLPNRSRRRRP